jgi:hypothetical protein
MHGGAIATVLPLPIDVPLAMPTSSPPKVCSAALHVGVDGVAILGGCDPSNIGAQATRIVYGREVGESPL